MITTVTLNPALDKIIKLPILDIGQLNRADKAIERAGGKGINVARIVHKLGREVQAISLLGGYTGKHLENILREEKIPINISWINEKTRENIKIVEEDGRETEINQKGSISIEDYSNFLKIFKKELKRSKILVLAGSLPQGLSPDAYSQLISLAKKENVKTILDTSGQALELGIKSQPYLIKPNIEELRVLMNKELKQISDIIIAANDLIDQGINTVVISLGEKGALYIQKDEYYHTLPPKLEIFESTVGAGDSMVGALSIAINEEFSFQEMSKFATNVASLFISGKTINQNNLNKMKDNIKLIDGVELDEIV
ncbi:1-phosphofructokinase [Natronospora cellulosivora (SeqCode)]